MNYSIEKVADVLETDASQLSSGTNFREDVLDWDSMRGFSILCMLEDDYELRLSVDDFLKCTTIGDLFAATNASEA